jgi:hypothetical protein
VDDDNAARGAVSRWQDAGVLSTDKATRIAAVRIAKADPKAFDCWMRILAARGSLDVSIRDGRAVFPSSPWPQGPPTPSNTAAPRQSKEERSPEDRLAVRRLANALDLSEEEAGRRFTAQRARERMAARR